MIVLRWITWLRQQMKHHRLLVIGFIVVLIAFTLAVWKLGWDWTGFNGGFSQITTTSIAHGTTTATVQPPGKTLWDLLQLLIVPIILAIGGFWLNHIQKERKEKTTEQRTEIEKKAAEKRSQTEREIAQDNQREAALQEYIDKMSELLLDRKLRESAEDDETRKIARVRTLTVLPRLDGARHKPHQKMEHCSGKGHKRCGSEYEPKIMDYAKRRPLYADKWMPGDEDNNSTAAMVAINKA